MPPTRTTRARALANNDDASTAPSSAASSPPPPSPPSPTPSALTSLNSRDFDDLSVANNDSYHQIGKPVKRRVRGVEDTALWDEALAEPPEGQPYRGKYNQRIFYCKRCKKACLSNNHAKNHLQKHGIILPTAAKKPRVAHQSDTLRQALRIQELKSEIGKQHQIDTEAWLNTLILMVVNHNLPHTLLEWPEFYLLMQLTNPGIVGGDGPMRASRWSIKQLLAAAYDKHKQTIIEKLQLALSKLHFTTDIWTSPNKSHYQAITCHFVDEALQLQKLTLALREHSTEGHGAEEQAAVFHTVLDEYGIGRKQLGYITGDNHGSNDKLCRLLAHTFTDWDPVQHRIRCMGHILNLACQAFLFSTNAEAAELAQRDAEALLAREEALLSTEDEYSQDSKTQEKWREIGALGKLHNIAVWLRRSPARYQLFRHQAGRVLPRDNNTRWNSWLTMLQAALDLEHHIRVFTDKYHAEIGANALTPNEWETLIEMKEILLPFKEATDLLQGDDITLDNVLWSMDFLIRHISTKRDQYANRPDVSKRLYTMWIAFDKYYNLSDATPAYVSALLLNPMNRRQYITNNWQKLEEEKPGTSERSIASARALWQSEYKGGGARVEIEPEAIKNTILRQKHIEEINRRLGGDEFESFINGPQDVKIQGTALQWWLLPAQRATYPRLSRMAIDVLSIPAMSAESERVFSGARRTITWERHRLSADVVEKTECIKSWLRVLIKDGEQAKLVAVDDLIEEDDD